MPITLAWMRSDGSHYLQEDSAKSDFLFPPSKVECGPPSPWGLVCLCYLSLSSPCLDHRLLILPTRFDFYSWPRIKDSFLTLGPRSINIQLIAIPGLENYLLSPGSKTQSGEGRHARTGSRFYSKSKRLPEPHPPQPNSTQGKPDDEVNIIVGDGDDHIWDIVWSV
jgi:hypothetical protein